MYKTQQLTEASPSLVHVMDSAMLTFALSGNFGDGKVSVQVSLNSSPGDENFVTESEFNADTVKNLTFAAGSVVKLLLSGSTGGDVTAELRS